MANLGKINTLKVLRITKLGCVLDAGDLGEVLMPAKYMSTDDDVDDELEVFLYKDSEDRLIAGTDFPKAQVGEFAFLEVVAITSFGAFLDWGLEKDLFVPFFEQKRKMEDGKSYIVYLYIDEKTQRIAATAKFDKYIAKYPDTFKVNQEVNLLISEQTDLGYKAIINNTFLGIIYKNEVYKPIRVGQTMKGYIKKVREDNRIDLSLQKVGFVRMEDDTTVVLDVLKQSHGFLKVSDNSSPDEIYRIFGISKKSYKKAVGSLYKNKLINIEQDGIRLVK